MVDERLTDDQIAIWLANITLMWPSDLRAVALRGLRDLQTARTAHAQVIDHLRAIDTAETVSAMRTEAKRALRLLEGN